MDEQGNWTQEAVDNYVERCYYGLNMVTTIIDIMEYPFPNVERTAKARRNAGVGITNLAYDMAKRGLKYSSKEGKVYLHKLAELHSFALHTAALRITRGLGPCEWTHKTKYPEGWIPLDTYNKNIDKVVQVPLQFEEGWKELKQGFIAAGGNHFSILEAFMPCESSSKATNSTNGLYPVRQLEVIKTDDTKAVEFLAPEKDTLGDKYELAYDIPMKDMLECYAIFQKFAGGGISADWYLPRTNFTKELPKFSEKDMLEWWLYWAWLGGKTRYYTNTENNGDMIEEQPKGCVSGACAM